MLHDSTECPFIQGLFAINRKEVKFSQVRNIINKKWHLNSSTSCWTVLPVSTCFWRRELTSARRWSLVSSFWISARFFSINPCCPVIFGHSLTSFDNASRTREQDMMHKDKFFLVKIWKKWLKKKECGSVKYLHSEESVGKSYANHTICRVTNPASFPRWKQHLQGIW